MPARPLLFLDNETSLLLRDRVWDAAAVNKEAVDVLDTAVAAETSLSGFISPLLGLLAALVAGTVVSLSADKSVK